jgi:multisubunit Na+/H+ antiporter MnhB subunit
MNILRAAVVGASAVLGIGVAAAMLQLPEPQVRLAEQVRETLDASGVKSEVTAVLLNFRGYDTLLEIAVLLLALLGVLATTSEERSSELRISVSPQPLLQSMARAIAPLMILVAGYLLWAGSHRPGGAFQAAAVLAASGVLLYLAGLTPAWGAPGRWMRAGLMSGFLIFLAVAAAVPAQGAMLHYPPQLAGKLIVLIESGLTLSLGLILAGLFLWLPNENEEAEE